MKTRELLDEYANNYSRIYDLLLRDENSTLIRRFRYENEEIIKELEASIRKETVLSLLERLSVLDVREPLPKHLTALDIHGWAKENGITLN